MSIKIRVPATSMRDRTISTISDLINNYLAPMKPYPLSVAASSGGISPSTRAAQHLLIARGLITISADGTGSRALSNMGTSALDLPYTALISGQLATFEVALPQNLAVEATFDSDSIKLKFRSKLTTTIIQKPDSWNALFTETVLDLTRLEASSTSIDYYFESPTNEIEISLLLTSSKTAMARASRFFSLTNSFKALLLRNSVALLSDDPCSVSSLGSGAKSVDYPYLALPGTMGPLFEISDWTSDSSTTASIGVDADNDSYTITGSVQYPTNGGIQTSPLSSSGDTIITVSGAGAVSVSLESVSHATKCTIRYSGLP
jgi:hypothetical protein